MFANLGTPPQSNIYPAWGKALVEVVDLAICEAWKRVKNRCPTVLATGDEDQITDELKTELVALRKADFPPGFNNSLFGVPTRDSKVRNSSGTSIDPTPDLTIYPAIPRPEVSDDQHDALFFECKVLDRSRGLSLYDKKGMKRFADGWYASRMQHAGMIAYVLGGTNTSPVPCLKRYLGKTARGESMTNGDRLGCRSFPQKVMDSPGLMASDIANTVHARPSLTIGSHDITLRHLWLLH
ncbi:MULTISPECIES: hypothetical protein [unclassified Burkholderia]|uniref:hypothetical protein n=1 Tax=unclassified Burkholderia TaxID=2613784 RepID=UPI00114CC6C9|nr:MULTISPECIES: hypothetical protein [unclassified Burkholderia]MBR8235740.1 hypothetical protein [Burkholderia sp. AU32357]MBY4878116.1 hypothetical protein [Burkholderia sp. AU42008]